MNLFNKNERYLKNLKILTIKLFVNHIKLYIFAKD